MTAAARAYVLADDLTGAADTALPFFGRGLSARIVLDADQPLPNADVLVFSTESRNMSEAEAIERVRHAAQRLRPMLAGSAPSLVYKKIDSTLRGWVGAEIRTLLNELPSSHVAWIVPSYPEQGRQMRGGVYTVRGVPLHQTEFARQIVGGLSDERVVPLLERQMGEAVGFVDDSALGDGREAIRNEAEQARQDGRRAVLFDAASNEHIEQIVDAGLLSGAPPILWVGSAGLAHALARRLGTGERVSGVAPVPNAGSGSVFLVAGSQSKVTREQVALLKDRLNPWHRTVPPDRSLGFEEMNDLLSAPATRRYYLLTLPGEQDAAATPVNVPLDDRTLTAADRLGWVAALLIRGIGSRRLVLTGGDTAHAVCQHLGARSLEIVGRVEEGVPLLKIVGGVADGALAATKAGGFGSPATLYNAVAALLASGQQRNAQEQSK
jgi:uncharacterized protein YgbK (DUF1537 family)